MDLAEAIRRRKNGEQINFDPYRGFHEVLNQHRVSEIICFKGRCFYNKKALEDYVNTFRITPVKAG